MGTSIMAVEFAGGVVLGADSRTTTGSYIANRVSDKITSIHDRIWVCRSGSAADTQAVSDYVRFYIDMHVSELGEAPEVKTTANLFRQIVYQNKDALMAGLIVAGWDARNGGSVWSVNLGGSLVRQAWSIGGSGSSYIYGYCDATWRPNMPRDDAERFVVNALSLAMARDGSSGGVVRTVTIDARGVERRMVPGDKLPVFYDK